MPNIVGNLHIPVPCWAILLVMIVSAFVATIGSPSSLGAPVWADAVARAIGASCTVAAGIMVASPSQAGQKISTTTDVHAEATHGQ